MKHYNINLYFYLILSYNLTEVVFINHNGSGKIAENISNEYCSLWLNSDFTNFQMCMYSENSNDCIFSEPCNGSIQLSWCSMENKGESPVGLEGKELKNGTVIALYCSYEGYCVNKPSNVMILNYEIGQLLLLGAIIAT